MRVESTRLRNNVGNNATSVQGSHPYLHTYHWYMKRGRRGTAAIYTDWDDKGGNDEQYGEHGESRDTVPAAMAMRNRLANILGIIIAK